MARSTLKAQQHYGYTILYLPYLRPQLVTLGTLPTYWLMKPGRSLFFDPDAGPFIQAVDTHPSKRPSSCAWRHNLESLYLASPPLFRYHPFR